MEISYYEMTEADIPVIAEMEMRYFAVPWSEASIGHYMDQGNTLFIVARHEPEVTMGTVLPVTAEDARPRYNIAGYIALMCILNESDLVSIAVHEDYRNMGIARELLDIAYEMAADRGVEMIHLEVRESNEAAITLYESEGFERDGIRKGYYDKPKEDALLFTKHLI